MLKQKILFICKYRESNKDSSYGSIHSSGLLNSAKFVSEMLNDNGYESKVVQVQDNNCIDREVYLYDPTHVIIEALWVVPSKFLELVKLYPKVKWIIRLHSETPFLSNEGIASEWLFAYAKQYPNIRISSNSNRLQKEYKHLLNVPVFYTPNYYPCATSNKTLRVDDGFINVGCFGAIRPLKNQLIQAHAAIAFADAIGEKLRFHINGTRIEGDGEQIYKNIVALFNNSDHELALLSWMPHDQFMEYIRNNIDIGLQVSFSETFNIVAADIVAQGKPVVVSPEVRWANCLYKATATSCDDITATLRFAWNFRKFNLHYLNILGLRGYNRAAIQAWKHLLDTK